MIYSAGPLCNLLLALVPCAILVRWLDPSVSLTGLLDPAVYLYDASRDEVNQWTGVCPSCK